MSDRALSRITVPGMASSFSPKPFARRVRGAAGSNPRSRHQRREELRHERQTLRTALIEELKINLGAMEHEIGEVDKDGAYYVPTDPMEDAYRAFTHRIGLLSPAEVQKVMNAYLSLRTYLAKLFLIGVPTHTSDHHALVPAKNAKMLSGMQESLIEPVGKAIQAMETARDAD